MLQLEFTVVQKYWEWVDEFVKLRSFSKAAGEKLFKGTSIQDKRSYIQLIINACVVSYNESIVPRWVAKIQACNKEKAEESLYSLCIEVNPHLDIRRVTLPAPESKCGKEGLPLIEKETDLQEMITASTPDLDQLELALCNRVIGQERAAHIIFQALRKSLAGLKEPNRPVGTFLFVGRTGVGKTEMAKAIVRALYNTPSKLIRIDCSEYALPHEYAKLIGSPPGYIGFDQGGSLTERTRLAHPCVVLFDEVEKAHQKIHHLLLQVMDEGFLTDAKGFQVPFSDCLIILTSNLGTSDLEELQGHIGFQGKREQGPSQDQVGSVIADALKRSFVPEFLNRLDEIVVFRTLSQEDCIRITEVFLRELALNLTRIGRKLSVPGRVRAFLAHEGYSEAYGAREIKRVIRHYIENPLAEGILEGRFPKGSRIQTSLQRGQIRFTCWRMTSPPQVK